MTNLLIGLFLDLSFFGGIALIIMSFFKKFEKHRYKMIVVGLLLTAIGIIFLDTDSMREAYKRGMEFGKSI